MDNVLELEASARNVRHDVSIEWIRNLPPLERLIYLELINIEYPRITRILTKMQAGFDRALRCKLAGIRPADPPCLLLVGRPGSGKTTLGEKYQQRNPPKIVHPSPEQPNGFTRRHLLRSVIPAKPTETTLARQLLKANGDPLYMKGSGAIMTNRLEESVAESVVQIMLDELQHFVDQESSFLLSNASNWLKNFIKENGIACVLIGKQGEAELVVRENPQLASLFGAPIVLEPFYWRAMPSEEIAKSPSARNIEGSREEFVVFLAMLEAQLPLNDISNLADSDRAQRLFVACEGLLRPLMILIRRACDQALRSNMEYLNDWLLADAFDASLAPDSRLSSNPFRGPLQQPRELPAVELKIIRAGRHRRPPRK